MRGRAHRGAEREKGLNVRCLKYATGDVPGAYTAGNGIKGTSFLVIDEDRGVVVGATFTGPAMQELLHLGDGRDRGRGAAHTGYGTRCRRFPTVSEVWLHLLEEYSL